MFWMFIAIVVVASIAAQFFSQRETQQTIRKAVEKGAPLDPETVERLLAASRPAPPNRAGLIFIGVMFFCIGAGIGLIGWFGSTDKPEMLHQALGAASLVGLLGVPFIVASTMVKPRGGADKP